MISQHTGKCATAIWKLKQSWRSKSLTTESAICFTGSSSRRGESCPGPVHPKTAKWPALHPHHTTAPAWRLGSWAATAAFAANPQPPPKNDHNPCEQQHTGRQEPIPTGWPTCRAHTKGLNSPAPSDLHRQVTMSAYGSLRDMALSEFSSHSINSRAASLLLPFVPPSHLPVPPCPSRTPLLVKEPASPVPLHLEREQHWPHQHWPHQQAVLSPSLPPVCHMDHLRQQGLGRALLCVPQLALHAPPSAPTVSGENRVHHMTCHIVARTTLPPLAARHSHCARPAALAGPQLSPPPALAGLSPLGSNLGPHRLQHGAAAAGVGGQGGEGGGKPTSKPAQTQTQTQTLSQRSCRAAESAERSRGMVMYLLALVLAMVGATYAAVPLYRMFCQATGFGGTVQRRETVEEKIAKHGTGGAPREGARNRELVITFNADVADDMPWRFTPTQREVKIRPGQSTLAFYTAQNLSDKAITGISTYNVSPNKAGAYFNKIQCFCFEEQRLRPGEKIDMPVLFYIDPEFAQDPKMDNVNLLTLSYTFFKVEDE